MVYNTCLVKRSNEYGFVVQRLRYVVYMLAVILTIGTAYYHLGEGMGLLDAFYMTVITVSTVGFGEVAPLSQSGRLFTAGLILFGVSTVAYGYSVLTTLIIEGQLKQIWVLRRRGKMLEKLKDHYIICGYGRMGKYISRKLAEQGYPFVIVERDGETDLKLETEGYLHINDNATNEETLVLAGIKRARGLVSVVSSDADNLFICLTARQLNPDIFIIARVAEDSAESKMIKAGANKVISPYKIGGERMAMALLKPSVLDFLEIATGAKERGKPLRMEEIEVLAESALRGRTLIEGRIREHTGAIIIAVKKQDGRMEFNPRPDYLIEDGDIFITLGSVEHLSLLEELCSGKR